MSNLINILLNFNFLGLGDTAYGWKDAMEMVQTKLPSVKFILPTA